MEDISNVAPTELLEMVNTTENKDILRTIATQMKVTFSGNTGINTLKEKLIPVLEAQINLESEMGKTDPTIQALAKKLNKQVVEKTKPKKVLELSRTAQAMLDPNAKGLTIAEKRAIVRAKAMRLHRVRVTNLDPNDSALDGTIETVYNKYAGKVSKYIPFGDENAQGYHIPEILLNSLKEKKYTMQKEVKQRGQVSAFGVKQYKIVLMPKFSIEPSPN